MSRRDIKRAERLLRDRDAIKLLREHFTGFEARDGFPIDVRKIAAMPYHRRRALRAKHQKVATLLSQPFDAVKAKTPEEAKALRFFTKERFKGMRHFIVHKPDDEHTVTLEQGAVTLRRKFPGDVEFKEQYFMFAKAARGPKHLVRMLEKMLDKMPEGHYVMQTAAYGDTGESADKGQLVNRLQTYLADYDKAKYGTHRFLNQITGFRYMSTTIKGAQVQQRSRDERRRATREHNRQVRDRLAAEARARARKERS